MLLLACDMLRSDQRVPVVPAKRVDSCPLGDKLGSGVQTASHRHVHACADRGKLHKSSNRFAENTHSVLGGHTGWLYEHPLGVLRGQCSILNARKAHGRENK